MTSLSPADAEQLRLAFQRCREMEGTLNEQLLAYADASRQVFPAYGEAVDRLVARLNGNGGGENAPRPGDVMPPFMLPDEGGRLVTLPALLAQGPVVVARATCAAEDAGSDALTRWLRQIRHGQVNGVTPVGMRATRVADWFQTADPWPSASRC